MIKINTKEIMESLLGAYDNSDEEELIIRSTYQGYAEWCAAQLKSKGFEVILRDGRGSGCFISESDEERWACEDLTEFWDWADNHFHH